MATQHLTEEELILQYYGEGAAGEEQRAAQHLESCARCHDDYRRLQRVLGVLDETAVSSYELPPSFERTVWARLEPNLQPRRLGWTSWLVRSPAPLALAATVVALVAGAFFAGRALSPAPSPDAAAVAAAAAQIRERI